MTVARCGSGLRLQGSRRAISGIRDSCDYNGLLQWFRVVLPGTVHGQ